MKEAKLFDSLDGLFAFDTGNKYSGIKNESLRTEVIDYLGSLDDDSFRIIMSTFIRQYFVSKEAVEKGYGIEDVVQFIKWLDKFMGIQL